jgi:Flp pilus assembly protein TadD
MFSKYSLSAYVGILLSFLVIGSLLNSEKSTSRAAEKVSPNKAESADATEKTLESLISAIDEQPDNSVLRNLLKKTFVMHIQEQISEGYDRIANNKHDTEGYLAVSRAYNLVGDRFRSLEVLTVGVMENPESVKLWLTLGLIELDAKRDAEALSVFKEVLHLDPKNAHAFNNIAFIESRSDDPRLIDIPEAYADAQQAVKLEPSNANFLDTLAEIDFRRGEKAEAVKHIRRAIALDPQEPFYQAQLSRFENGQTLAK